MNAHTSLAFREANILSFTLFSYPSTRSSTIQPHTTFSTQFSRVKVYNVHNKDIFNSHQPSACAVPPLRPSFLADLLPPITVQLLHRCRRPLITSFTSQRHLPHRLKHCRCHLLWLPAQQAFKLQP